MGYMGSTEPMNFQMRYPEPLDFEKIYHKCASIGKGKHSFGTHGLKILTQPLVVEVISEIRFA